MHEISNLFSWKNIIKLSPAEFAYRVTKVTNDLNVIWPSFGTDQFMQSYHGP